MDAREKGLEVDRIASALLFRFLTLQQVQLQAVSACVRACARACAYMCVRGGGVVYRGSRENFSCLFDAELKFDFQSSTSYCFTVLSPKTKRIIFQGGIHYLLL
jgi:hypothetical protein